MIYFGGLGLVIVWFCAYLVFQLRDAILIGSVFTTLVLGALPWHLIPVDGVAFSVQLFFMSLAFLYRLLRNDRKIIPHRIIRYNFSILMLWVIVFVFNVISGFISYGVTKTAYFMLKGIVPVFVLQAISPFDKRDFHIIFYTILVGSIFMALSLLAFGDIQTIRVTSHTGGDPINSSRVIGLGATLVFVSFLLRQKLGKSRLMIHVLLIIVLSFALLLTAARGALFATVFAIISTFLFVEHRPRLRIRLITRSLLGICVVVIILATLPSGIVERYASIQRLVRYIRTFGENTSDRARLARYSVAWESFCNSRGIGVGTGGFAAQYGTVGRDYPHNLVLEVAAEQGVLGLLVLAVIVAITFRRIVSITKNYHLDSYERALVSLWFFALFNSFVSSDISGNYFFWVMGGIVWLMPTSTQQETCKVLKTQNGQI
jgi:O-antigen ligase